MLFLSLRVDIQWWFFLQFYRVSDVYLCLEMVRDDFRIELLLANWKPLALYIDYLFKMVISHSYLVGGLEHFLFSPIVGMMIQSDFHIFQRGRYTTNQLCYACVFLLFPAWGFIHIHPLASENVPNPSISGNQRVHVIFPVCSDGLLVVYPHKTTMYGKSSN